MRHQQHRNIHLGPFRSESVHPSILFPSSIMDNLIPIGTTTATPPCHTTPFPHGILAPCQFTTRLARFLAIVVHSLGSSTTHLPGPSAVFSSDPYRPSRRSPQSLTTSHSWFRTLCNIPIANVRYRASFRCFPKSYYPKISLPRPRDCRRRFQISSQATPEAGPPPARR